MGSVSHIDEIKASPDAKRKLISSTLNFKSKSNQAALNFNLKDHQLIFSTKNRKFFISIKKKLFTIIKCEKEQFLD